MKSQSGQRGGYVGLGGAKKGAAPASPLNGRQASPQDTSAANVLRQQPPASAGRLGTPRGAPHEDETQSPRNAPEPRAPPQETPAAPGAGGKSAIVITGCTGKYKLINDTYEPMQMTHQNRPCWCARSAAPVYLFHTGKSRWVISKRINDGARCYAFVSDNSGSDPTQCPGPWMCCGEDGNWNPDQNITCRSAQASQDKFVLLRVQVEEDLSTYGLMDNASLKQLWRKLDKDGNNISSLAEIDSLVNDMVKAGIWPDWVHNKQSMMRAYKKTIALDGDGDDWVEKEEFHSLLLNLFWFGHLHQIFEEVDTNHDDKIDINEFTQGMSRLGITMSPQEAEAEYRTIDMDHGGMVLFVEFCAYVRRRVHPDHNPAFDADIVAKDKSSDTLRKKHGDKVTHGQFVNKKSMADFDKLEANIKGMMGDQKALKKLWTRLDFNNNGIVSLAEVDKLVTEQYPLLNHKPALMRAFQSTLREGDGDEWVEKHEFKMLLGNLFYFNKLFWLFDQVDDDKDRRMTFKEFQWCLSVCGIKMSETKCQVEFQKVDVNGGGIILFDEFCRYFTDKHCPESMKAYVDGL